MIIPLDENVAIREDVKKALQASSDRTTVLCTHDNIKPWAKYKPVNLREPFPDRSREWWRAEDGNCGLIFNILSNLDQVINEYQTQSSWQYEKVVPSYPKRLADFRGYYSEATPPFTKIVPPEKPNNKLNGIMTFTLQVKSAVHPHELSFADLRNISEGYFGIAVYGDNGFYRAATAPEKVSQQKGTQVIFNSGNFLPREYTAVPFFAMTSKIVEGENLPTNKYITIPNCGLMKFTVADAASVISPTIFITGIVIERTGDLGLKQLDIDVTIRIMKLGSTEKHLFEPVFLTLRRSDGFVERSKTWPSWDVDINNPTTTSLSYTFENVGDYYRTHDGIVKVTLSEISDWSSQSTVKRYGGGGGFQPIE